MPGWMWGGLIAGLAVLGLVVWTYRTLVGLSRRADGAWSDIDEQLRRRWELIPPLVEAVRGCARHEREAWEATMTARRRAEKASNRGDLERRDQAETTLATSLGRLVAVAEANPDLKVDRNFLAIQRELIRIENQLQASRRSYNTAVGDLNRARRAFPAVLVAGLLGFPPRALFQPEDVAERSRAAVRLKEG